MSSSNTFRGTANACLNLGTFKSRPLHTLHDVDLSSSKLTRVLSLIAHFCTCLRPVEGYCVHYLRCLRSVRRRETLCFRRSSKWTATSISLHSGPYVVTSALTSSSKTRRCSPPVAYRSMIITRKEVHNDVIIVNYHLLGMPVFPSICVLLLTIFVLLLLQKSTHNYLSNTPVARSICTRFVALVHWFPVIVPCSTYTNLVHHFTQTLIPLPAQPNPSSTPYTLFCTPFPFHLLPSSVNRTHSMFIFHRPSTLPYPRLATHPLPCDIGLQHTTPV